MDDFRPRFFELLTDDIGERKGEIDDNGVTCEFISKLFIGGR